MFSLHQINLPIFTLTFFIIVSSLPFFFLINGFFILLLLCICVRKNTNYIGWHFITIFSSVLWKSISVSTNMVKQRILALSSFCTGYVKPLTCVDCG